MYTHNHKDNGFLFILREVKLHTNTYIQLSSGQDFKGYGSPQVKADQGKEGRNGDLSEGDSHNIDILPSWLHFGLTWSYKGYCQSKVVFQKELQRHVRIIAHTHNLLHAHAVSHGFPVLRNKTTQTSLHDHTMTLMWLRTLSWMGVVLWKLNGFKCQHVVYITERVLCRNYRCNISLYFIQTTQPKSDIYI